MPINIFTQKRRRNSYFERIQEAEELQALRNVLASDSRSRMVVSLIITILAFVIPPIFQVHIPTAAFLLFGWLFFYTAFFYLLIFPLSYLQNFRRLSIVYTVFLLVDAAVVIPLVFLSGSYSVGGLFVFPLYIVSAFRYLPYLWQVSVLITETIVFLFATTLLEYFRIIVPTPIVSLDAGFFQNPQYLAIFLPLSLVLLVYIGYHGGLFVRSIRTGRSRLRNERNHLRALIENLTDGLFLINEEEQVVFVNPRARELLDLSSEEILGKKISAHFSHLNLEKISEFSRAPQPLEKYEISVADQYDRERILGITKIPLLQDKKEAGYIIVLHDITREKEIDKMRSSFVKIASHKIRTPLSEMKWLFSELLAGSLDHLSPEQKSAVGQGFGSVDRLTKLISELLDAVSIEEGKFGYQFSRVIPRWVVEETAKSFIKRFESKKINFSVQIEAKLPEVDMDKVKIGVVLYGILDNAFWYTYPKGRVELRIRKVGDAVEIAISDTGVGIPDNERDKIFQKFFRGNLAMRLNTEGTGLSLYIAKNVIVGHKGKIWFESKEGAGSTFFLTLPISQKVKEIIEQQQPT